MNSFNIKYMFRLPDDQQCVFDLEFDAQSLDLMNKVPAELPPWTNLEHCKCRICPFPERSRPHCPAAVHLVEPVKAFQRLLSHETIHVDILTPQRVISKNTNAQKGVSSLMGLLMATSGCPLTEFFKPMARFHLPLADAEETIYRAISMYLLAQYFLGKEGWTVDMELEGLKRIYTNVQIMNEHMIERVRTICEKDVAINSLVILNVFAQRFFVELEDSLREIRTLFIPYLESQVKPNRTQKEYRPFSKSTWH